MDRIRLPLLTGDVSLANVFGRMAKARTHAAVVALPGKEPVLVTNHDVDEGLERGLEHVGEIDGRTLHVAGAEVADWESVLDAAAASYGMVARGGPHPAGPHESGEGVGREVARGAMVTIVTRSETLAADIRNAGQVCRCRKYRHRAQKGKPCPFCRSAVDCA